MSDKVSQSLLQKIDKNLKDEISKTFVWNAEKGKCWYLLHTSIILNLRAYTSKIRKDKNNIKQIITGMRNIKL